jgi:hypothetical protein
MMDRQSKDGVMTEEQLQEYLDKGGKITKCPPGARTEDLEFKSSFYGRKPKKKEDSKDGTE